MATVKTDEDVRLSRGQLDEVMALLPDVDSVELKMTVPVDAHRATVSGLPLDPVEAEPRQVYFFDTPDLALSRAGVVVRARRIRGGRADTVVKLRPVVPANLPDSIRHSAAFKVEVDIVPGGYVCSGSLKGKATGDEVRDVAAGKLKLSKLLSREQRAFYRKHAPQGLTLDSLSLLGPTFALKAVFAPKELDRKTILELWLYPDGTRLLELSTKAEPTEANFVGAAFRAYLEKRGVPITGEQEAKTRIALEFYSAQLRAKALRPPVAPVAAAPKKADASAADPN